MFIGESVSSTTTQRFYSHIQPCSKDSKFQTILKPGKLTQIAKCKLTRIRKWFVHMTLQASVVACLVIAACSCSFWAPTTLSTSFPSFKNRNVGIASTAHSSATVFNSSTSTLRKVTFGSFLAISAKIGAMKRHGPHQEAVKSTTICQCDFVSVLWTSLKLSGEKSTILRNRNRRCYNLQYQELKHETKAVKSSKNTKVKQRFDTRLDEDCMPEIIEDLASGNTVSSGWFTVKKGLAEVDEITGWFVENV